MTDDDKKLRLQSVRRLFDSAMELPGEARIAFVTNRAGADRALAEQVIALLTQEDLGASAALAAVVRNATGHLPRGIPEHIGPYRVLDEIGHGGMGVVYRAVRSDLDNLVAIKVSRQPSGSSSSEVLARFERERRTLAVMNHRYVARIFDAGTTEFGQPYFVMEFVVVSPLTVYCDRRHLGVDDRLRLFQRVCEGVQHAHAKSIVHRDLKPDNVLVVDEGGEAVPKVLDFGLAKALDPDAAGSAVDVTDQGRQLGTILYMSPEQALGRSHEVDVRSDLYSLGVMLYELLTGTLPFSRALLEDVQRRQGRAAVLELLATQEPVRPSQRVTAADMRRRLAGDLDNIVAKAIAKEPERRYQAATALAEDIDRHLDHLPVAAVGDSTGYRLRKFARRYRGQLVAIAAVLVTAIVGMWVAIDYARRASRQEAAALASAKLAAERLAEIQRQGIAVRAARDEALLRAREAEGRRLLALATNERVRDPGLSVLLAIEGATIADSADARDVLVASMLASGRLPSFDGHRATVTRIRFSGDGRVMVTGDEAGVVIAREFPSGNPIHEIEVFRGRIRELLADERGDHLAALSEDRSLVFARVASGELVCAATVADWPVELEPVRLGTGIEVRNRSGPLRRWSWQAQEERIGAASRSANVLLGSPDGSWWLVGRDGDAGESAVAAGGALRLELPAAAAGVVSAATDASGGILATVNASASVHVFATRDWALRHVLMRHDGALRSVAVSPDGRWLLASELPANPPLGVETMAMASGSSLHVYDVASGERRFTVDLDLDADRVTAYAISRDSGALLFATEGGRIRMIPIDLRSAAIGVARRRLSRIERETYQVSDVGGAEGGR